MQSTHQPLLLLPQYGIVSPDTFLAQDKDHTLLLLFSKFNAIIYTTNISMNILTIIYNLAVSCWLGGASLFTFLLTPMLFRAYSRDMAGNIVGLLFPGYFRWGLVCGIVALLCQLINRGRYALASILIIGAMLLLTTLQAYVVEPRAAELKQAIGSFETTPPDHPLRVQFRKLHSLSMAANLAVIAGGIILVVLASLPSPGTGHSRNPEQSTPPQHIAQR